jgi:hypothetical protein
MSILVLNINANPIFHASNFWKQLFDGGGYLFQADNKNKSSKRNKQKGDLAAFPFYWPRPVS